MAWVEALLTKAFIEEGASDVEGFKALEKSFSHQHRGQQMHSHFMRPLCQSTPRAPRTVEEPSPDSKPEPGPPTIIINGGSDANGGPKTPSRSSTWREDSNELFKSPQQGKENAKDTPKEKLKKGHAKGHKSPKGTETPNKDPHRKATYILDSRRPQSPASPGPKETPHKGNVFIFMPYLHFESTHRHQEMQEAIRRAETLRSPLCPYLGKASTYDEMLIRAHLTTSTVSLHVRRTLDQSFYHNIDTTSRDEDQVVYRYQLKGKDHKNDEVDPKIVMVDQLWMWILGKDLIVTSFPQRWQQPKNDPLNVLDSVIEDINSKTREPVKSVYDLAMIITSRCSGVFDRHRMGDEEYQFLDMFESSIGSATDRETVLFKEFNAASVQASAWLQHHRRPNRFARHREHSGMDKNTKQEAKAKEREEMEERYKSEDFMRGPVFVDKLLDIGQETDLLAETKDIRDELNMIAKVLEDQAHVLPDLQDAIGDIYKEEYRSNQQEVKKRFRDQLKMIEIHIKDIDRMDRQAERIYDSITDMLDLKQKHANAFEARFARDQAAGTARQSQTIMVFTIVTIIFLPLSFIAAFFAINISEFPRTDSGPSLPIGYVSKYMFGLGLAVSIPLIIIAVRLDDIADLMNEARRRINQRRRVKEKEVVGDGAGEGRLDMLRMEEAFSVARSARKSLDTDWIRERISMSARPVSARTEKPTGFRMRVSQDIERGPGVELRDFGR
jgi:Mg2+ and Co2+ transporter CorA